MRLLVCSSLFAGAGLRAQSTLGPILGTVKDSSGAVVAMEK
jgi:hypothetical protein